MYEKLSYEALHRHFCKTAVRCWRSCLSSVYQHFICYSVAVNMSVNFFVGLCVWVFFIYSRDGSIFMVFVIALQFRREGIFLIFCLRLATCKLFDKALVCAWACAALVPKAFGMLVPIAIGMRWLSYVVLFKVKINVLPAPNLLSTVICPPCASINSLLIASPSPVPSFFVPGTRK